MDSTAPAQAPRLGGHWSTRGRGNSGRGQEVAVRRRLGRCWFNLLWCLPIRLGLSFAGIRTPPAILPEMNEIKTRTIRGGAIKLAGQVVNFVLRLGSLMVLGRLLDPRDFGLMGMVTALTGVLNLFRDFGLSTATVQRSDITEEQLSTVFWINLGVGLLLGLVCLIGAPFVASFYGEPRLLGITAASAIGFVCNAAGVQHSALLQRQMRFAATTGLDVVALVISVAAGIGLGMAGYGYWALVWMALAQVIATTAGAWLLARWVPGTPKRNVGVRSMMQFGGTITLNGLVVYFAYNLEKVLLGRFWGAEAIGIYGRAYQLINIPTDNLNSAVGGVAFSALSRLQSEPLRMKRTFLKSYSLFLAVALPVTIWFAAFADDVIAVFLGPKWVGTEVILRALAPSIVIFALINPLAWLGIALGIVRRSLNVAIVLALVVISSYLIGLPYGPTGVAIAYSTAMVVWAVPHIAWFIHGTIIRLLDIVDAACAPMVSGGTSAIAGFGAHVLCLHWTPLARLLVEVSVATFVYAGMFLFVFRQKDLLVETIRGLKSQNDGAEYPKMAACAHDLSEAPPE